MPFGIGFRLLSTVRQKKILIYSEHCAKIFISNESEGDDTVNREKRIIAKNGIPVFAYTNENSHSFFISAFLKSGSMYESERENGITHFLEHISIRNINKLMGGKLYPTLDRLGMEFNASTYGEMVQFYITGASENFKAGAEIISMILSPIVLDPSEIDAERARIKAEIREADDKSTLAHFTALEVWGGTSLSRPIAGTLGSVSRITLGKLEAYRRRSFTSENCFFYVSGNVSDEELELLAESVGGYSIDIGEIHDNTAPVPSNFGNRAPSVKLKNADFTKIRFSFDVDMSRVSSAELDLLYDIVLGGYNSDFFVEMSEKRGLFYDLGGSVERYANVASFTFSYEVKESKLYEAVQLTCTLLDGYASAVLDEARCMKAGYIDNAYMLYDDTRELNFTFAYDNHVLNLGYSSIEDRQRAYALVTPERIREVAAEIFNRKNLTVTMKGNRKRVDTERLEKIIYPLF